MDATHSNPDLTTAYQQGFQAAQDFRQGYQAGLSAVQGNMQGAPVVVLQSKEQIIQKYAEMDRSTYIALAICAIVAIAFTVAAAEEETSSIAQLWFWICAGTSWGFTLLCFARLYNNSENQRKELRAITPPSVRTPLLPTTDPVSDDPEQKS